VTIGDGSVPVSGIGRSGIPADAMVEGRQATIVGIVKRAYPTASDQRFALVPRSTADIHVGPAAATERPDSTNGAMTDPGASVDGNGGLPPWPESLAPGESAGMVGPSPSPSNDTVAVADLAGHIGQRVAVGGFVTAIDGSRLTVQDETAATVVRLSGDAMSALERITVGDLVNATGLADRNATGGIEINVSDPADIIVLPPMAAALASPAGAASPSADRSVTATPAAPTTPTSSPNVVGALILLAAGGLLAATFLATPHNRARVRMWLEKASTSLKVRLAQLRSS
jgi:hypothetical protein